MHRVRVLRTIWLQCNDLDQAEIRRCAADGENPKSISARMQIPVKVVENFYPGYEKVRAKKAKKKAAKKVRKAADRQMLADARAIVEGVNVAAELSPQQRGAITRKANEAAKAKKEQSSATLNAAQAEQTDEDRENAAFERDNKANEF